MSVREAYRKVRLGALGAKFAVAPLLGAKARFGIDPGYAHRRRIEYFDDTVNEDEWQREVYQRAHDLMIAQKLSSVSDVGCGSGYKLVKFLGEFETLGVDLPETIQAVQSRYPNRKWLAGSFDSIDAEAADLVICSDVIEHVLDPGALMRFIVKMARKCVVLSTPARELLYDDRNKSRFGPPENPAHVREWSTKEFARFISRFLHIESHEISNLEQATQMIVGRPKQN